MAGSRRPRVVRSGSGLPPAEDLPTAAELGAAGTDDGATVEGARRWLRRRGSAAGSAAGAQAAAAEKATANETGAGQNLRDGQAGEEEAALPEQPPVVVTAGAKVTVLPLPALDVDPLPGPAPAPAPASKTTSKAKAASAPEPAPTATVLSFPKPAFKVRRQRLWLVLGSVAAVIAVVVGAAIFSPILALKTITIDGNKLATMDVLQASLAPLEGKPLPQIDEGQVAALLAPLPQVDRVSIEARPPSTLLVHIVEREPVALLKDGESYIMVDPAGVALGTTADPAAIALPLIDGGTAVIGNKIFVAITSVLAVLPQSVLTKLEHASAESPDAVELALSDGKKIIWGNDSQNELKAEVLDALLNSPMPPPGKGQPERAPISVYDVSTPKHPVTR
ncbi:cell division protein FtsQ/DivIB [Arthrobacter sp. 35W]|uniref:cell division protein FtsQ/DivIB n=1 Tax=Arthrobacter sp. 35W TaxID=1132441 RepID=UPI000426A557|nr:FtsQ-type POTRA domain-containing protein [Arthrobacter sp. 35W]